MLTGEELTAHESQSDENELESAASPTIKRKTWYHRIKPKGRQESRSGLQKDSRSSLKKYEGTFPCTLFSTRYCIYDHEGFA